jgi:hypothetical protein
MRFIALHANRSTGMSKALNAVDWLQIGHFSHLGSLERASAACIPAKQAQQTLWQQTEE